MIYTVFTLHTPGDPEDVRYIGMSSQLLSKRVRDMVSVANHPYCPGHTSFVSQWIRSLQEQGLAPAVDELINTDDKSLALDIREEVFDKHVGKGKLLNAQGHKLGGQVLVKQMVNNGKSRGRDTTPDSKHAKMSARTKTKLLEPNNE